MKRTSTLLEILRKSLLLLFCFTTITLFNAKLYGQAKQAVFANTETNKVTGVLCLGCAVNNEKRAVDGLGSTASTIIVPAGIAAKVSQDLIFPTKDVKDGAVIKVGTSGKLVSASLGGISFQKFQGESTSVGPAVSGSSSLVTLLTSDDQIEIFIPAPTAGETYDRIRVILDGGLVGLFLTLDVYHAYYLKDVTGINCDKPVDEIHGVSGNLLSLGTITNPQNVLDESDATYSTLNALVGLVGYVHQKVIFPGLSAETDSVRMLVSTNGTLLSLGILSSIEVETFSGSTSNGVVGTGGLLSLKLLSGGQQGVITFAPGKSFDRVQLRLKGVANVLNTINLHRVTRIMALPTSIAINNIAAPSGIACMGDGVVLNISDPELGATYTWYKTEIGGTGTIGTSYTPTNLASGIHDFYVSGRREFCSNETPRKRVRVIVNNPIVPVVTTPNPICAGGTITLVVNAVAGQTYKWYEVETGGTEIFTGTNLVIPALAANKSYYVEAVIGACVSVRTKVDVTVNPIPADAQVILSIIEITKGQTATLTATPEVGSTGSVVNWYNASTGGTLLATGNSFTTPALNANNTYYAEIQSAGGCVSANRVAVTVKVTDIDPNLTCNVPNAQSNGVGGLLCLLCSVENAQSAIDGNPANFSSIRLTAGVIGWVYQRLTFPNAGVSTDSIRLDLGIPGGLADLSVLGGITVHIMNKGVSVKNYPLNAGLLHVTLLGGGRFKVTIPAGVAYDAVEIRLGAVATLLTTVNIYGAEVIYPNPILANTGLDICSGTGTTLTATPVGNTNLKWFANPSGGTALAIGNTYSPTGLTENTIFYIEVSNGLCVNTERLPVTVNVNPAIVFVGNTLTNATAGSAYSKQITLATGGTPEFTYALTSLSKLPTGLTLSADGTIGGIPAAEAAPGNYSFTIAATDSKGCSVNALYNLKVTEGMTLPTMTLPNGTVNTPYPTQVIPGASGGTTPYTYVASNLPPGLTFDEATREIKGTPTKKGTYLVPVTVTDANGNSISTDYTIVVRDPLVLANTTLADGTVNILYPTQTIPAATGGSGSYTYTATGLPPGLTFDPDTRQISGTPTEVGTYTVPVQVKDTEGNTVITNYTIVVGSPLILAAKPLADGIVGTIYTPQTIPAATGGAGAYVYEATNLPQGLTFDPSTRTITGTPTHSGSYNISVKVTDGKGATAHQTYVLKVTGELNLPSATLPDGLVGTVYPTQTLPAVTGGISPYTYKLDGLPPALIFDPATREIKGTPLTGGTLTITLTATDKNGLTTSTDYTLQVNVGAPVVAAVATCSGTVATLSVANVQPGVTYNWYAASGSAIVFTGTTYTTDAVNANTTYYVQAVSGTALSSRTPVNVTINPAPDVATVITANESISAGQSASLSVTAPGATAIKWYTAPKGGAAFFTGANYNTPALSGTTTYYVETENATGCVSLTRAEVTVNVSADPSNPNCNAATRQETGIDGLCLLCSIEGAGNSTDANLNNFTKINLTVGVGATGYQRLIFPGLGAATDSIRLDLATPVGLADVNVLGGITITVMNGNTVVATYPLNNALIDLKLLSGNRFKATLPAGGVYDRVEIRFGALVAALSNLSIYGAEIIYPGPTIAATGKLICAGSGTTLSASANGGTTLKWYATATGGTALATGETFTIAGPLTINATYYIEVSKNGCANVQRVPVTVTVTTPPSVPTMANSAEVCAGSPAILAVDNPVIGTSYKWYTTQTGGTAIFEGPVFTSPALSANISYYVEAANGSCVSASRAAVTVIVNPLPLMPNVQVSSNTVSPGQTAILNATSTETNVIFNWYTTANAPSPIYTGPTYVTTPLMVTTTYYLEATSTTTGCAATSRVQITISVDGGGAPNPVPCEAATLEMHGVDGIALLAGVFNPQLAVDDDTKTGSSLVVPVGLLGGSVYQRLKFNNPSTVGDTIRIKLTAPGKLLSLGVLSGITLTTYNGSTSNSDVLSLNNSLIHLELLSGNTEALLSFVPSKVFDQVEVRLNAGIAGVLTTVDINYAQRVMVAPTAVSKVINICANQTTTLEVANPSGILIYKWYDAAGTYIAGRDGTTFLTGILTADTKYYVAASNAANCTSYKTLIEVKVTAAPATPELESPNINTCANTDVILRVKNPIVGITYQWFDKDDQYLAGKDGATLTVTVGTTDETYTVKALDGNICGMPSSAATATIIVGVLDAPVITQVFGARIGVPIIFNASSSTIGMIFTWYDVANGGTPISTGPTFVAPPVLVASVVTYYVEGHIPGGCSTDRTMVSVFVLPFNGGSNGIPCEAASSETNGTNGVIDFAGVYNPGNAVDTDDFTASTLLIPEGFGGYVYQRLGFNGSSNLGDTVRVFFSSRKMLTQSNLPSLEISTLNNGVNNGDATMISNPLIKLEFLNSGTQILLTFVPTSAFDAVEVKLNSALDGAPSTIDINYAQRVIQAPKVTAKTVSVCEGSSATLSVDNPLLNETYRWYQGATFKDVGTTYTTAANLPAGSYDFFVSLTRNGCESAKVKIVVTILPMPAPPVPDAGNQTSTCINSPVILKVTAVSGVVFNWYNAAIGGNQLVSNNSSYTTPANLAAGTYDYYVEAANTNSCTNTTRTKITLVVKSNALATDIAVNDQTICIGSTATLTATVTGSLAPIFKWYTTPTLTDTPIEGPSFTTPALTATTKYYVTVGGPDFCANDASSAKVVTVTVNRKAIATDINVTDKIICSGTATNLTASSTKVTNPIFSWYKNADLSDPPFVGANFTTDILTATTKYYVTVSGSDACANDAASAKVVTVTVNRNATAADIDAADKSTCMGTAVTLMASSSTVTNPVFSWYRDAQLTDLAIRAASFTTPALTATTIYYVTVSSADVCVNDAASAKKVTVTVNRNAIVTDIILKDETICAGTTAILSASSTTVNNPVFRWYRDASLTDFAFQGPTFTTPALTLTAKYYVTVSGSNACANDAASAKMVTVIVNRNAGLTDIIIQDQTICAGVTTELNASSATVNHPVFTWYHDAALSNVAFVGAKMPVIGLTATEKYYVTISGDGVCANLPGSAKVVTVTVNPLPNVPIIGSTGTAICSGDKTVLTIQNPQTDVVYEWYTAAIGGVLVKVGTSYTTDPLSSSVDYFVQATNATNCGSINGRVKVSVVVSNRPQVPSVLVGTVNTCIGSTATLSVSGAQTGVAYNWYATATSTDKLGTGVDFITPTATTATTTYYVEAASGTCISTSRTPVVVKAGAVPLAPTSVSGAENPLCPGSTTVLTVNNPDPSLKYTWYSTATGGTGLANGTTFNVPVLSGTTIYYVGSSDLNNGCASATRIAITVKVLTKLDAPVVSVQSATATSITFAWPAITGAIAYEVSVDNGLNWISPSSGAAGTTHQVTGLLPDQKVTIRVRAKGQQDCQLSDATTFTGTSENPLGNDVFVPNTFTPNNDGKNDVLYVYGNTIAKMQLRVYNQWGQFLFESLNIQNGWDGTYKGQMQPNGVYVYYLEVEFNDGTKATKKGTITLLR